MKKSKVRSENHIVIQGFMVNELDLKGNELIIYAIIYGFSQTENQRFTGSLQYLADWTNSTKQGVLKNLKSLIEKGFIEKQDKIVNGVKFCEYHSTKFNRVLNKDDDSVKQSLIPSEQSSIEGVKQSLNNNIAINNIDDNINNNIDNNKVDKEENLSINLSKEKRENEILENEFEELWLKYPKKKGKQEAFESYVKYRKSLGSDYVTKEDVEKGIDNYNRYIEENNVEDDFIKYGSTYFEKRGWEEIYFVPKKVKVDTNNIKNDFLKRCTPALDLFYSKLVSGERNDVEL